MDAWDVYWVMQADAIGVVAILLTVVLAIPVAISGGIWATCRAGESKDDKNAAAAAYAVFVRVAPAFVVTILAATFIPSTKTLCACIAVPAIANNEQLQADATDIYKLGMERLKEELGGEKSAPAESK
jgi:hypothetical protein